MRKYTVEYEMTGCVTVFADNDIEAIDKYSQIPRRELIDKLELNSVSFKGLFDEECNN